MRTRTEFFEAAKAFIDLVQHYTEKGRNWEDVRVLSREEATTLLNLLEAADLAYSGSNVIYIKDSKEMPKRQLSPFVCGHGRDHLNYQATMWLDRVFSHIFIEWDRRGTSSGELVTWLTSEISSRLKFKPIILTAKGDMLDQCPPIEGVVDQKENISDEDLLEGWIGKHVPCGGMITRRELPHSNSTFVIECDRNCCDGKPFFRCLPSKVKTYGDLRAHLEREVPQEMPGQQRLEFSTA